MRHSSGRRRISLRSFQSTHPLRGATIPSSNSTHSGVAISIHAPLAGCDQEFFSAYEQAHISIHAPLAGCDAYIRMLIAQDAERISIHAPLAGCDPVVNAAAKGYTISIHAPLAGCDSSVFYIISY